MKRRGFLVTVGAGLAGAVPGRLYARTQRSVEATPTLLHGHPDGLTTLVRFTAPLDAPAGRLRVIDLRTGRLLGTAGMIQRAGQLTGELWLPLTEPRRIRSELETPATRGVLRTVHSLDPTPRWVIHWLVLASPDAVRARFAEVPPLLVGVEARRLALAGVRVNPWGPLPPDPDHLDLLRVAVPAVEVSRRTGVPVSRAALHDGVGLSQLARVLRATGVPVTLERGHVVDPAMLGVRAGRTQAAARIEAWLQSRATEPQDGGVPVALVVGTDIGVALDARSPIEEWNDAYAFPRFVVGRDDALVELDPSVRNGGAGNNPDAVTRTVPAAVAAHRPRLGDPFEALARLVSPDRPTMAGLASRFAFPVGGALVFNPSPFGRSGLADMPSGASRVVTDVPGLGYAFVPDDAGPTESTTSPDATTIRSAHFGVRVNRQSGGIVSLFHRPTGRELVLPGQSLNALPAVVSSVRAETVPNAWTRLVLRRVTSSAVITSTVTAYDALPWIDIDNRLESGSPDPREWGYALAGQPDRIRWEVPGGWDAAMPPTSLTPIRWMSLEGAAGTVLVGVEDAAAVVADDGRVTVRAGMPSRVRITYHAGHVLPDDPWRFGFSMLPLAAHRAGGGNRSLPTFGRMLDVGDPTVALLAVLPALDGIGTVAYLQELGGPARDLVVRPGLLTFESAVLTDLAERDREPIPRQPDGSVHVPIAASGYAAVRLLGVGLGS